MSLATNSRIAVRALPLLACLVAFNGCSYFRNLDSIERLERGYTIVLPGIETASMANSNIAQGLKNGGVETAIEVHDWTTGSPLLMLVHLRHLDRNRREARELAHKIVEYQDAHPEQPVYLIGHSGGGGLTLLTLEALPDDRKITAAILLAPAISPGYDLSEALAKTETGIWNFHSPMDAVLLVAGTTVAGTIDGVHSPAAGAVAFEVPADLSAQAERDYRTKLHQVPYSLEMAAHGNLGGHFGSTWLRFTEAYLAPIIRDPVPRK